MIAERIERRFLTVTLPRDLEEAAGDRRKQTELVIVDNWFEEFRRLAPRSHGSISSNSL
ncbi:MAG TPA: hypothetical protein VIV14_01985 [Gammaproteobacteria bacterium]